MSEIETALCEATSIARNVKNKEGKQRYMERLFAACEKLFDKDEEEWDKLGAVKGAQDWFNAALKADKAEKPIPDFPDAPAGDQGEPEAEPAKGPKKAAGKTKADGKPAPKADKPAKSGSPAKAGARGVIIQLTIKKPGISVDDMITELDKRGLKPTKSAVSSLRSFTRATIKVLQQLGYAKEIQL